MSLDSYPFTVLLSFLVFVEGCVRIDTVARQPLDRLTYHITDSIITLMESTHNNMALSAACDLMCRMTDTLSPRQLTVSDQSYYSVIRMYIVHWHFVKNLFRLELGIVYMCMCYIIHCKH